MSAIIESTHSPPFLTSIRLDESSDVDLPVKCLEHWDLETVFRIRSGLSRSNYRGHFSLEGAGMEQIIWLIEGFALSRVLVPLKNIRHYCVGI